MEENEKGDDSPFAQFIRQKIQSGLADLEVLMEGNMRRFREMEREILDLKKLNKTAMDTITEKDSTIKDLSEKIVDLQKEIIEKDEEIEKLTSEKETAEEELNYANNDHIELEEKTKQLELEKIRFNRISEDNLVLKKRLKQMEEERTLTTTLSNHHDKELLKGSLRKVGNNSKLKVTRFKTSSAEESKDGIDSLLESDSGDEDDLTLKARGKRSAEEGLSSDRIKIDRRLRPDAEFIKFLDQEIVKYKC